MLTVLQIIPNMGAGGAEQACVDIVEGLQTRGDRAIVITKGGARCEEIRKRGGEVILCDVATKNPAKIVRNAFWLARFAKQEKVDLIHARSRAPAWSAYLASKMAGISFVTTFHAAYKFNNAAKRAYNSVMAKGCRVIAISHYIADHIRKSYPFAEKAVRVVPRGIDLSFFRPAEIAEERRDALRKLWGIEPERRVIFLPARLSAIKGQSTLIDAMAKMKPYEKCVAIIAGDAQGREGYHASLLDRIAALGLVNCVRVVPHCTDMAAAYSLSSVAVVPSRDPEGFGRVPVEAMAMGVPVIASALGGAVETIIDGKTGWLVPPEDSEALAALLRRALGMTPEESRAMALTARAHVEAHYDKAKMVTATLGVYDEIAAGRA
jgi:glycosyltransferase involved in cell wall biosynthesis